MSKDSSVDSDDEELFIDVDEDRHHLNFCRGLTCLTPGGGLASNATVLSLQAMVDAVVDCASVDSPSSSSALSWRSVVRRSSSTSSPRCSPSLGPASPTSAVVDQTAARPSNCDESLCHDVAGRRRLPDVVQLPSIVRAPRHHRRSFLIEEILRPDFGRRRPPTTLPPATLNSQQKQFPAEVGVNHVTSIWQPFAASPTRTIDNTVYRQDPTERGKLPRSMVAKTGSDRKKSVKGKSQDGDGVEASSCVADESATRQCNSSRSMSSASSSSSSSSGSDVSAVRTESSTNVTPSLAQAQSKVGQLPLPAWVFCTRYSDRPSSGIGKHAASYSSVDI